jgi:hypothetical protein
MTHWAPSKRGCSPLKLAQANMHSQATARPLRKGAIAFRKARRLAARLSWKTTAPAWSRMHTAEFWGADRCWRRMGPPFWFCGRQRFSRRPRQLGLGVRRQNMTLNLAMMHGLVVKELASKLSLRESMDRIIERWAKGHAHDDWEKLRALPYDDLGELREWIEKPFSAEPSRKKLAGLWFGLFNPVYDTEPVADIYVCGSTRFDPNPDDNSWANGPDWVPEDGYAHSSVLASIYKIAYRKDGLGNDAEYPLALAYGGVAVGDLLRGTEPSVFLGSSPSLGVAVGFDSGDHVLVGKLNKAGIVAIS